jgi:hypothetical protein
VTAVQQPKALSQTDAALHLVIAVAAVLLAFTWRIVGSQLK